MTVVFSMYSLFQCQHDCLLHEGIGDSHEHSQARGQSASATCHAKYWAYQVAQEMEGQSSTLLFTARKLPAGLSSLGLSCSVWRKKFMLILLSKSYEIYHPSRMEEICISAVMSKMAIHWLVIGVLLLSDLILQEVQVAINPRTDFSKVC